LKNIVVSGTTRCGSAFNVPLQFLVIAVLMFLGNEALNRLEHSQKASEDIPKAFEKSHKGNEAPDK
jgi:large-conductance mechanosensitive channel